MIVDASFIEKVNNGEIIYGQVSFNMIDDEECKKLIKYMFDNNLVIEPGIYKINQAWSADQIIEILKFKEK